MSKPFAICIENLNARSKASRYLRCVALPGRQSEDASRRIALIRRT